MSGLNSDVMTAVQSLPCAECAFLIRVGEDMVLTMSGWEHAIHLAERGEA